MSIQFGKNCTAMALAHTILVILASEPRSGYDVSKVFDESIGCFWKASQQQVYRELAKMEQQGWVYFETIPQVGKPDKKIYHLTEQGQQELMQWFTIPTEPTPIREDLLVKVLAGPYIPRQQLLKEIHYRRQRHLDQLTVYQEKEALYQSLPAPEFAEQFRYLTLRRGIRYETAWLDWCDEVLAFMEQIPQSESSIDSGDR
jgi:DNA-binding PadR family transcriptional regulator